MNIVQLIEKVEFPVLEELMGVRSLNGARKYLKEGNVTWESLEQNGNKLTVSFRLKNESESYIVDLRWSNRLLVDQCSCGKRWKPGLKTCSHVATVVLGILDQDPFFEQLSVDDYEESTKPLEQPNRTEEQSKDKTYATRLTVIDEGGAGNRKCNDHQTQTNELEEQLNNLKLPNEINEVLDDLERFVLSLAKGGLQRCSQATLEWLNALVIKTRVNKLIILEKELKRTTEVVVKYLQKSPDLRFNDYLRQLTRLTNVLNLTRRLLAGKPHPHLSPIEIIGQVRSEYRQIPDIQAAQCLGVQGWVSETGFVGVTAYFVQTDQRPFRIFKASNVRPSQYLSDKSPIAIYKMDTHNGVSFENLSDGSFSFINVKLNRHNNLSFHKELMITPSNSFTAPTDPSFQTLVFKDWVTLLRRIQEEEITPITRAGRFDRYVVVEPSKYTTFSLDEINQNWKAPLLDGKGRKISLLVPNERSTHVANKITAFKIFFDNKFLPNALFGIVGNIGSEVTFTPISGWFYQGIRLGSPYLADSSRGRARQGTGAKQKIRLNFNFDVDNIHMVDIGGSKN